MTEMTYPNENETYRSARNALLNAEAELRQKIAEVAELRAALPAGGRADDYVFQGVEGALSLSELFDNGSENLILYSYMFGSEDTAPCPMCSAFLDSVHGHLEHITQRSNFAVVVRSPIDRLQALARERGWTDFRLLSAAENTYAQDYHTEMPGGAQVPMCNVFTKRDGQVHHHWGPELFFVPTDTHPRHLDMLWPLWHFFDLLPEGRGDFMPRLSYD